jgi:hypothetical protein
MKFFIFGIDKPRIGTAKFAWPSAGRCSQEALWTSTVAGAKLVSSRKGCCIVDIPAAPVLPNEYLQNARVLGSRHDILPFLPTGGVFCEVGVAYGDFSAAVLAICQPRKFIAIDHFELEKYPNMWGWERLEGQPHEAFYRNRFRDEIAASQVELMRGYSHEMLPLLPDVSVDVFYVDAWHSYEAVAAELEIIKWKIVPGGWIVLNDYTLYDVVAGVEYGVIHAAHEFMLGEGWEMKFLALHPLMFCDIALQKM